MDFTPSPIICFQHCQKDADIVCFDMPDNCPLCQSDLETTEVMEMPPFRLPCPFVSGASSPFSLLIQPTSGNFVLDYKNSSDLHVGVTDSRGTVYDFDNEGLHTSTSRWPNCLAIPLEKRSHGVSFSWDTKLQEFAMKPEWQASKYDEVNHNCYHFVINFLQYYGLRSYPSDSTEFCETIILPKTIKAAKYIVLYRKLQNDGLMVKYYGPKPPGGNENLYEQPVVERIYETIETKF